MPTATETQLRRLLPSLLEEMPQVIAEVVELLRAEWPDYAAVLDDDAAGVTLAAQEAMHRLVALAEGRAAGTDTAQSTSAPMDLFEEVGRMEWREGRSLSTLLSAYRAGARVAWQHVSRIAVRRRVAPQTIAQLAEAVFVFIEELSSASARGYVNEQQATAGQRERQRAELAELLLSERADLPIVHAAAAAAGWQLPRTAALVILDGDAIDRVLSRVDARVLPVRRPGLSGVIIPDPSGPGRRSALSDALRGNEAVVGTAVAPRALPATVRSTVEAHRLRREGVLAGDPLFVEDHFDTLIVHGDEHLLELLSRQVLSPIEGLPPGTQNRLLDTLQAWLAAMGDHREAARALHVHPQTVRYRLGRLRQLFGSALDEPSTRLRLTLALCWRRPMG